MKVSLTKMTRQPISSIDLNCDMGELKAGQHSNYDAEIMPFISSCNIACGFHSGTPPLMEQTIKTAIRHQVKIGAHPSYNDRKNFGRISLKTDKSTLMAELSYQICALKGMVERYGKKLNHVKPHGALYNDMVVDTALADQFVQLVKAIDPALKIIALADSGVINCCKAHGIKAIHEGFADRRYEKRTQLRSRAFQDAVLHQPEDVLAQVQGFLRHEVRLANGQLENIQVDSICLHSDTLGAAHLSKTIYHYLKENNVKISAIS